LKDPKTPIVEVVRRTPHPLYKKLMKRSKRFKVDSSNFELSMGQRVRIEETRPLSKDKYFKISGLVLQKGKGVKKNDTA